MFGVIRTTGKLDIVQSNIRGWGGFALFKRAKAEIQCMIANFATTDQLCLLLDDEAACRVQVPSPNPTAALVMAALGIHNADSNGVVYGDVAVGCYRNDDFVRLDTPARDALVALVSIINEYKSGRLSKADKRGFELNLPAFARKKLSIEMYGKLVPEKAKAAKKRVKVSVILSNEESE